MVSPSGELVDECLHVAGYLNVRHAASVKMECSLNSRPKGKVFVDGIKVSLCTRLHNGIDVHGMKGRRIQMECDEILAGGL